MSYELIFYFRVNCLQFKSKSKELILKLMLILQKKGIPF